jgi:hypothetical protein
MDQIWTRMISKRTHALGFVLAVKELREPVDCAFRRLVREAPVVVRCDAIDEAIMIVKFTGRLGWAKARQRVSRVGRKMPLVDTPPVGGGSIVDALAGFYVARAADQDRYT